MVDVEDIANSLTIVSIIVTAGVYFLNRVQLVTELERRFAITRQRLAHDHLPVLDGLGMVEDGQLPSDPGFYRAAVTNGTVSMIIERGWSQVANEFMELSDVAGSVRFWRPVVWFIGVLYVLMIAGVAGAIVRFLIL